VIAEMVRLRLEGYGYDRIAAALNDGGIPTRQGRRWHGVVVKAIMRRVDPALCPRRAETPGVRQHLATMYNRDLDRQRKHRAALRSEASP
jgi:Recombinase